MYFYVLSVLLQRRNPPAPPLAPEAELKYHLVFSSQPCGQTDTVADSI